MELTAHFENIRQIIMDELTHAEDEIIIAVAWFTNHDIFNLLVEKANKLPVSLIIMNDNINNKIGGLEFQELIDNGGKFYYGYQESPMHNKFCIIDRKILITGSYNYTYLADAINQENIIKIKGASDIIDSYLQTFHQLITNKVPIKSISDYLCKFPYDKNVLSYENYGTRDTYYYISLLKRNGHQLLAKSILDQMELSASHESYAEFKIEDVIYKQWKQNYFADHVTVADGKIVITFRTISDGSCWINGPRTKECWILRNSTNFEEYTEAFEISDIKINGKIVIKKLQNEKIIHFSNDGIIDFGNCDLGYCLNTEKLPIKSNGAILPIKRIITTGTFELKCDIHFQGENFINETVDLIEGLNSDLLEHHWHCFDINLKLNRIKL